MDTISIIMPLYNSELYLEDSINSVIQQTYANWELWIIDDHSTDKSYEIAKRFKEIDARVHLIQTEQNSGAAIARNLGIKYATGRYIAFLDSDDTWYDEKLERQINHIQITGGHLCYTSYALLENDGKSCHRMNYIVPSEIDFKSLLRENVIGCSTVLVQSDLIKNHPFKTSFYHEDYVLWLELLNSGIRAVGCCDVLVDWRYHSESRSFDKIKSVRNRWKVYRNAVGLSRICSLMYLVQYCIAGMVKYGKK